MIEANKTRKIDKGNSYRMNFKPMTEADYEVALKPPLPGKKQKRAWNH